MSKKDLKMTLPVVLVIDDVFGRNGEEWRAFLAKSGLLPGSEEILAEARLISGQICDRNVYRNDYKVIKQAIEDIQGECRLSMVLLDCNFFSGRVDHAGQPKGKAGDESFGLKVRSHLQKDFPDLPVVMLTDLDHDSIGEVRPYVSKNYISSELMRLTLLEHAMLSKGQIKRLLDLGPEAIAEDPSTVEVFIKARRYAGKGSPILLLGDTGVGKEIVASYIVNCSDRKDKPFVKVNIASLSKNIIESELFGYKQGAFTDATSDRPGYFETANGGTLFLDEIGDMPVETQAKVLRVLQERKVTRVGDTEERPADFRLICATWRDLDYQVQLGEFRQDLLYRIKVLPIRIPSLAERRQDIKALVKAFLSAQTTDGWTPRISDTAMALLESHTYDGNIRELKNIVQRLVAEATPGEIVGVDQVSQILDGQRVELPTRPGEYQTIGELISHLKQVQVFAGDESVKGCKPLLEQALNDLLRKALAASLECCRNGLTKEFNIQQSMRYLTGNQNLGGVEPGRVLNEILGHPKSAKITKEERAQELEALVEWWMALNQS